jgi:poly-gamma-glutamate capsule biosynthesis protein CapA/YwtB (metallophosphatase superfamily)
VEVIKLFLSGDVMMGRGIDQVLPWPCEPTLHEPYVSSAKEYVALAEAANGPLPRPVDVLYPWGDALAELQHRLLDARIINLETSVTRRGGPEPKGTACERRRASKPDDGPVPASQLPAQSGHES